MMSVPHKPSHVTEVDSADAETHSKAEEHAVSGLPMPASASAAHLSRAGHLWAFCCFMGPTWLIAATFVDPGGVTAALQQGSETQFSLLWITWWSIIFGYVFQVLAARVGIISGKSLGTLCVERYGRETIRLIILFFIQASVFGDDIQACVGATVALQIMTGLPWWACCLLTIAVSIMLTLAYYWSATKLELCVGALLLAMLLLVCINAGAGNADGRAVLYGWVVPQVPTGEVLTVLGSVGGVLTPSALFLGSALVLKRPVSRSSPRDVRRCLLYSTIELMLGMLAAFFILFAITITFANGFYRSDCAAQQQAWVPSEGQCDTIALGDGPDALHSLYGVAAKWVFAVALLFSGINSMVSATLAGQATWEGLCVSKIAFWKVVVVTRSIVMVPTLALAITQGNNDTNYTIINDWVNIYMSLAMPIAAIPVIDMASSHQFMGNMAIRPWRLAISVLLVLVLIGTNFYLLAEFLFDPVTFGSVGAFPTSPNFYAGVGAVWLAYAYILLQVARPGATDLGKMFWSCMQRALSRRSTNRDKQ